MKRHRLDDSWDVAALSVEHTKTMLTEGRSVGLHTHVAFNPPENIVGVQPIDEFIVSMPLRTLKNSEPAP